MLLVDCYTAVYNLDEMLSTMLPLIMIMIMYADISLYMIMYVDVCWQLPYHPGHDDLVTHIISLAFRHFKYREM